MEKQNLSKKEYNIIDVYNSPAGSEYYYFDSNSNFYRKVIVYKGSDGCKYISNAGGYAISLKNSSEEINRVFYKEIKEYTFIELSNKLAKEPYQKVKVVHPYIDKYLSYCKEYKEYHQFTKVIKNLATDLSISNFATILSEGKWYIEGED